MFSPAHHRQKHLIWYVWRGNPNELKQPILKQAGLRSILRPAAWVIPAFRQIYIRCSRIRPTTIRRISIRRISFRRVLIRQGFSCSDLSLNDQRGQARIWFRQGRVLIIPGHLHRNNLDDRLVLLKNPFECSFLHTKNISILLVK